jgi:hypothetical protein
MDLILVSNILSRLIRSRWVEKTNEFRSGQSNHAPTPLMIWLEEAHKRTPRSVYTRFHWL